MFDVLLLELPVSSARGAHRGLSLFQLASGRGSARAWSMPSRRRSGAVGTTSRAPTLKASISPRRVGRIASDAERQARLLDRHRQLVPDGVRDCLVVHPTEPLHLKVRYDHNN